MPRLFIDVEARFAQFQDSLDKIGAQATSVTQQIQKGFAGVASAASAFGAAISVTAFAAALRGVAEYRAALDDLAKITGGNVTQLDALAREAKISGVAFDQLESGLTKFARNLSAADDDGQAAARAIKAIGLNIANVRDLKPDQAFLAVAKALDQFEDGAGKVAIATALLGRDGAKLLPLLKDLAEAGEIHGRVTAEQAAQAVQLEKEMRRLTAAFDDNKQSLATGVIPAVADWLEANREMLRIAGSTSEALRLFVFNLDAMTSEKPREEIERLTKALEAFQKAGPIGKFFQSPTGAIFGGREEDLRKQIELLKFLEAQQSRGQAKDPNSPFFEFAGGGIKPPAPDLPDKEATASKLRHDQLVIRQLLEDEQRLLAERVALNKFNDETTGKSLEERAKGEKELTDSINAHNLLVEEGNNKTVISINKQGERVQVLKDDWEALNKTQKDGIDIGRELGLTFTSAFEDAVIAGKDLSEVLKGIGQDIERIILRKLVTEPIANQISQSLKGFSFGSLFSGDSGPVQLSGPARAGGGPVTGGRPYIVGEEGPELFVPGMSGGIMPNGGWGGGDTYYINAPGADAAGLARLEGMIRSINGSIERRAVRAQREASRR